MELGSKRGSEQEREADPKRPRVDGMVQIPTQLMDAMIPYLSRFPDELWQQLLVRLPQESVDNIHADINRLKPNHFMRKKFEEKDRLEVDDFFDNLAPTGAVLSEDAGTLTLTLSENFRSIFKKPLEEKIVLQRSNKSIDDKPNGRISSERPKPLDFGYGPNLPFYFMNVDPGYSDHFKRLVEYAETYLYVDEELFRYLETGFTGQSGSIMDGIRFQFQIAGGTVVVIINVKTSRYEGHDNQLIVYFVPIHPDDRPWMPTLPTHELAKNFLDLAMTRLKRRDALYGNRERELRRKFKFTVQPPLGLFQTGELSGQWNVDLGEFGALFAPSWQSGLFRFREIDYGQGTSPFGDWAYILEPQDLPPDLKVKMEVLQSLRKIMPSLWFDTHDSFWEPAFDTDLTGYNVQVHDGESGGSYWGFDRPNEQTPYTHTWTISKPGIHALRVAMKKSEDDDGLWDVHEMVFAVAKNFPNREHNETLPDLKALWHYTQPPRQGRTVNMAAVRRKDLLGLH